MPFLLKLVPFYYAGNNRFKGMPNVTGYRIKTVGVWKGKACLSIPVIGEKPYDIKLDFEVSDKKDDIPFLKLAFENNIATSAVRKPKRR